MILELATNAFRQAAIEGKPVIYVDALAPCMPNRNWRWGHSCHLFTEPGNMDELHAFAARIGLRREWCQHGSVMVHYDLNATRRIAAVEAGAVEVDRRQTAEMIKRWREWRAEAKNE